MQLVKKIKKLNKNNKKEKGLTLIELLISLSVFMLVIGGLLNIFVSNTKLQKTVLAEQRLINQSDYLIEYIQRALRMAKKELNCLNPSDDLTCDPSNPPYCLSTYNKNYDIIGGGQGIKFINPMRVYNVGGKDYWACQEFYLDSGQLREKISAGSPLVEIYDQPISSNEIEIENVSFSVSGIQPLVKINFEFKSKLDPSLRLNIENSVSQRDLNRDLFSY